MIKLARPSKRLDDSDGDGFAKCALLATTFDAGAYEERLPSDKDAARLRGHRRTQELHHITRAVHTAVEGSFDSVLLHHLDPLPGQLEEVDPRTAALEWVGREMEKISWQITLDSRPGVFTIQKSAAVSRSKGAVRNLLKKFLAGSRFSRKSCRGEQSNMDTDSSSSEHLDSEDDSEAVWGGDAIMQVGRPSLFVAKRGGCNVRSQKNLLQPCGRGPWGGERELPNGTHSDQSTNRKSKSRRA